MRAPLLSRRAFFFYELREQPSLSALRARVRPARRRSRLPPTASPWAPGVEGIIIANYDGVSLKSTLSPALTAKYAGLFAQVRRVLRLYCLAARGLQRASGCPRPNLAVPSNLLALGQGQGSHSVD